MKTARTLSLMVLPLLLTAASSCAQQSAPSTIHIRVLDGYTGNDLSGMQLRFVDYHSDDPLHPLEGRALVEASVDGHSYTANPRANGVLVFEVLGINGNWIPCTSQKLFDSNTQSYGNEHLYPVSEIIASGFVTKNSCSKQTATAKPGELVVFVRRTTWWERFISGMES